MKPRHASPATQVEPVESAKAVGLRYVSDETPGIKRLKSGHGFRYIKANGKTLRDAEVPIEEPRDWVVNHVYLGLRN